MAGFDPQDELPAKLPGIRMRLGSIVDGASEANCKTDTKVSSTSACTVAQASVVATVEKGPQWRTNSAPSSIRFPDWCGPHYLTEASISLIDTGANTPAS